MNLNNLYREIETLKKRILCLLNTGYYNSEVVKFYKLEIERLENEIKTTLNSNLREVI